MMRECGMLMTMNHIEPPEDHRTGCLPIRVGNHSALREERMNTLLVIDAGNTHIKWGI